MLRNRKLIRLAYHDYSSAGAYFVTICCKNRKKYFGKIIHGEMSLSEIGLKASEFWIQIPEHFKNVVPDAFVIMPEHIHGIINITGTYHGMSQQTNKFSHPVKNSLSVIINQYKSTLKRWCNKNGFENFRWQSRFHARILFPVDSLERTRKYIITNPQNYRNN